MKIVWFLVIVYSGYSLEKEQIIPRPSRQPDWFALQADCEHQAHRIMTDSNDYGDKRVAYCVPLKVPK